MTSKSQDVKVFPGDESTKFRLAERTIDTGGALGFIEAPPYILNATGNNANGVDVTKWHSVTVTHTAQDYAQAGWAGCSVTFIPWRYYKPITPQAAATPPAVNIPPQGAWIADNEETIAIDAVTLGITQQKVYSTLNCDKMFFQITSVLSTGEEELVIAGAEVLRQSVFGVTPRQDDGYSPTVVGAAGAAGAGGGVAPVIPDPVNTNVVQLAGNPIDLQAGNVGAGTQRVTIATDDVNLAAINAATAAIEADTGNIDTNVTAILADTANIDTNVASILADTANIDTNVASILADTATIDSNTAIVVTNTGNCATALQIMDDWDAVHDGVAGTDGVRLEGYASDSQVAAVSANGDDVRLALSKHGEVYEANHTYATQSNRTEEIDPANQWYEYSTLTAVTNGTDGTYYYYIPMASFTRLDMQLVLSGGSGTITITVEGSIQADGTAPASLSYLDVTNQAYGSASFTSSIMLVDNSWFFEAMNYVRVKVVAASGANDADWTIFIKKTWN